MQTNAIATNLQEARRAFAHGGKSHGIGGIRVGLAIAFVVMLAGALAGRAQMPGPTSGPTSGQSSGGRGGAFGHPDMSPLSNNDGDYDPVMTERRVRALNSERQKQMVADANKLLKLAKELNDEVATASESSFTSDQLRKIAEIEKLAKNVRERMTAGIGQAPNTVSPPNLTYPVH
jgi:hypothetical protein